MNKLVILTMALLATMVQGDLYGSGPLIEQVRELPLQAAKILGGSAVAAASSPAHVYGARPLVVGRSYAPSISYAPVRSVVAPAVRVPAYGKGLRVVPGYNSGLGLGRAIRVEPNLGYNSGINLVRGLRVEPSLGYNSGIGLGHGIRDLGYGAGLRVNPYGVRSGLGYGRAASVQPLVATQLTGGPTRYRTYQSPPTYSTVALPVLPSAPVAKLFVPKRTSYGVGPGYGVGPAY